MRLEIFVLGLTAFFIYNAYSDGKYSKMLLSFKKYYKMIFYAVLGVGIYVLLKRNPNQGRNMLLYANNVVKFMPIDKTSMDMLSPIFDLTSTGDRSFMENCNNIDDSNLMGSTGLSNSDKRIVNSGKNGTKRSVEIVMVKKQQVKICKIIYRSKIIILFTIIYYYLLLFIIIFLEEVIEKILLYNIIV
jgi:hypothetical protein